MIIFLNHWDQLFCDVFETPNNNNDYFTVIAIIGPTINRSYALLKSTAGVAQQCPVGLFSPLSLLLKRLASEWWSTAEGEEPLWNIPQEGCVPPEWCVELNSLRVSNLASFTPYTFDTLVTGMFSNSLASRIYFGYKKNYSFFFYFLTIHLKASSVFFFVNVWYSMPLTMLFYLFWTLFFFNQSFLFTKVVLYHITQSDDFRSIWICSTIW